MAALALSHIRKSFDGNPAVRDISFAVGAGKVLALVGENGAGKSTLMRVLSGAVIPDGGTIELDGKPARITGPADAMAHGIRIVYQELSLLPHLSVAENILLGRLPTRGLPVIVDWAKANRIATETLAAFGFSDIDPRALVRTLSVARQQLVEIAKALVTEPKILVLDEPTAVLSAAEATLLFAKVRALAAAGTTVIYISHRLEEIFDIADEVVVLKDGQSVLHGDIGTLDQASVIEAMVGRPLEAIYPARDRVRGKVVLDVEKLTDGAVFSDIGFSVRAGEIVGMFGLVGSGRTEIAKTLFGAHHFESGHISLDGAPVRFDTPAAAVGAGLALITEDRKGDGLALDASILDNAGLASLGRSARAGIINDREQRRIVDAKLRELSTRMRSVDQPVRQLSGGNQQKVVLAKWLLVEGARLYIFDEPTRGVDIATKVEIYQLIANLARAGAAVLLISSEMPEVLGLSDRLLVLREGRIAAELVPDGFKPELVFAHAAGLHPGTDTLQ
ncbi:sugar ABC transporter ATP-binding protein [Devosia sp. ZB163]|uniref:sugar ABC transporter ATP-binding protein n=1 Tax=Devosia sp. ZB163 TaxID=3025938 RepID=UPI0023618F63|nr:sugar ABC transporter ATP-binding protein [Devosia sp. ZB163]MDC9825359.1 sugar ABC transporter ATP-binding protein [Devosia sp. ZB163]